MNIKKFFLGCVSTLMLASCADMDYKEYSLYDEDYIKQTFGNVYGLMSTIYYSDLDYDFGNHFSGASLCSATDEAVYSHQGNSIENYYNGAWSASTPCKINWDKCWEGIAYCNTVIEKFDSLTFSEYELDLNYKAEMEKYHNMKWECRALRAYFYLQLVKQYGGVPLIDHAVDASVSNSTPRASSDSIFQFIDDECAAIKDSIVLDYSKAYTELGLTENGRISALGVVAVRAQAALYHASPLFSEGKTEAEKTELWRQAALRAQEAINLCRSNGIKMDADYSTMFQTQSYSKSNEIIFARRVAAANSFEKYNFPIGLENAGGGNCPTQNLVDAYEMTNGKAITDADSGYDPTNPYDGRDVRLAKTVAVNGEKWPDNISSAGGSGVLETYYGGVNSRSVTYGTPTGYYLKKYVNNAQIIGATGATTSYHTWVIYRLGQLYLDYAEAAANASGDGYTAPSGCTMTPAAAINIVRARAGQPDLPEGLSFSEFMERYKNERFVELAFEGHRFFDIRRWKEGAKHTDIKVMEITMNADSTFTYATKTNPSYITSRQWDESKMNLFPIPQSDVMKSNLTQNPGW